MNLPDIPPGWIAALLIIALVVMRAFGIDSFTTAGIAAMVGWVTGREQGKATERASLAFDNAGERGAPGGKPK